MLEVDYEILRNEGADYPRKFTTHEKLRKIDGNALYIKAPNASGKSTLLNVIALALYGDRLEDADCRISESLRSDIRYMASRPNQNYTFNLMISSKDGNIKLVSSKENSVSKDITVKEIIGTEETYLPFQTFKEKYFLIYDIPEDPLNHITELLDEVKNQQKRYHKKISDFRNYLGEVKLEIARSRDEEAIHKLTVAEFRYQKMEEEINSSINYLVEQISVLESYLSLREFAKYIENSIYLLQEIEKHDKKIYNTKKAVKNFNTQYGNKTRRVDSKIKTINKLIYKLSATLEHLFIDRDLDAIKKHIEITKKINLEDGLITDEVYKKLRNELAFFTKQINDYLADKNVRESGKKGSFYQELINLLKQYRSIDISFPGFDKNIKELLKLLEKEYEDNRILKSIYDDLNDCLRFIADIELELKSLPKEFESIKVLSSKVNESFNLVNNETIENQIEDLSDELNQILEKIAYYKNMAHQNKIYIDETSDPDEIYDMQNQLLHSHLGYKNIFQLGEDLYLNEIQKIKQKLEEERKRHDSVVSTRAQNQERLKDLEAREIHRYYNYSTQIDNLSKMIDTLDQSFIKYESIIHKISKGDRLDSETDIQYNDAISSYFANKIPEFPYINEFVKPSKIDFLNKTILLDDGREIDMKDISTGQSMSMYIQAILNRPEDDKRRMVVIFDEGATMDSNSLKPIQTILAKQIDQNKILLAVFAKAVDDNLTIDTLY